MLYRMVVCLIFLVKLDIRMIHMTVSTNEVVLAVQALDANKPSGLDGSSCRAFTL